MLYRLMGTETEYAIRYRPGPGDSAVDNEQVFDLILAALREQVPITKARGMVAQVRKRVFTANGGAIYYEHQPRHAQNGLVEGATPECRGPGSLLRYQRAQDRLLARAVQRVRRGLSEDAELSLRKNARDAVGNIYGPQESYEAPLASGLSLWLWRIGVVSLLPLVLVSILILWSMLLVLLVFIVMSAIWAVGVAIGGDEQAALRRWERRSQAVAEGIMEVAAQVVLGPPFALMSLLVRAFAWRPQRRALLGFLVSRCIVSGAGSLEPDGSFVLCEKISGLRRTIRWTAHADDRAIFEIGHLFKDLGEPMWLQTRRVKRLLRQRQRLQLSLSDSNRCDVAEYLKLGTTALILDLAEAGALSDAPRPSDPMGAARDLSGDPDLNALVAIRGGDPMTALQLQRWYHRKAAAWLDAQDVPALEAADVVYLWGEVLDALEQDPERLVGQLDWVTKRALLDRATDEPPAVRKRIDLGYHDLGDDYHQWLADEGLVRRLVEDDDIDEAIEVPPHDSPAGLRGRLVRQGGDVEVDWVRAKVRGQVIRLDQARRRRD